MAAGKQNDHWAGAGLHVQQAEIAVLDVGDY